MRAHLVLGVVLALAGSARADVFAFKDLDGFEKCLRLDHLVETERTDKGEQTRLLPRSEIQRRCVDAGVKVVAAAKDKDLALRFVTLTTRLASPRLALELVGVLVDLSLPQCNEMAAYTVLLLPLSDRDEASPDLRTVRVYIRRCLADKAYARDFLDEKDSTDERRAARACQLLVEAKLVTSCKRAK